MVMLAIYRGDRPRSADAILPCGACHACCQNEQIFLYENEGDVVEAYQAEIALNPATGVPGYRLKHKNNGDCVYLEGGRCSIWHWRPVICRIFDCADLWAKTPRPERKRLFEGPGSPKYEAAKEQFRRRQQAAAGK